MNHISEKTEEAEKTTLEDIGILPKQSTFSADTIIQNNRNDSNFVDESFHKISIDDIFVQREPDESKRKERSLCPD